MTTATRAEVCAVACAELFRDAGEILVSPMTTMVQVGARLARLTFAPDILLTDGEARLIADTPALGAAAALFVPPEVVARPFTDTSTVAAEPSASPSARVDLNVGPFTKTPNACKVIADSLVQELVPSAEDPSAYENDDYRSCTWRSAFQTPEAKRATLSVTLNRIAEQWLAESTFDLEKRVQRRLAQDVRDVPDLGHEAFSYVRAMRTPLRQYQVTYKFRLSNLQATIEYERSVSVDPDGSIQQGAEKTARAVLDALLKNPD